jgi:manganese/zinc/iron transport system permease protein
MMADAISHSIFPGLVAGYVLAQGPNLLTGFAGAAASGLLTVVLVEALTKSKKVKEDAAIGIVFPALFALGVFLVTKYFDNLHLDADAILFGVIEYSPFEEFSIGSWHLGPKAFWVMLGLFVLNAMFMRIFFKELKVSTFDPELSKALGFSPSMIHYSLMALVAATTVGAFSAVGAILAVALIIVPAVTASLLTYRLKHMIVISLIIGATCGLVGFWLATLADVSISGMIATMLGAAFLVVFLFAPNRGVIAQWIRRRRQGARFLAEMLAVHLDSHEGTNDEEEESRIGHLVTEMEWANSQAEVAIAIGTNLGWIVQSGDRLQLTAEGRRIAQMVRSR